MPVSWGLPPVEKCAPTLGPSDLKIQAMLSAVSRTSAGTPSPGPAGPEMRAALESMLVPTAWPVDEAMAGGVSRPRPGAAQVASRTAGTALPAPAPGDAEVARLRARWKAAGLGPVLRHLTGRADSTAGRVLGRCGCDGIDPALASFFAIQSGLRSYVRQVRRLADDLIRLGDAWTASGQRDDAALAYGVAIVALARSVASSSYAPLVLAAAEDLPRACTRLAAVADAQGRGAWAARLRDAAARWDGLYTKWREAAAGPPNMLPNTGSAVYHPAEHRSAMLALTQVGLAFAALCTYALLLLAAVLRGVGAACRRRPAGPVRWATPRCGWVVGGLVTAVPTLAACGLLRLAGDDWSWLSSSRLVTAVILLVAVAHVSIATLAAGQLLRGPQPPPTPVTERLSAASRLLALLLATTAALLIVSRRPEARRAMIPPGIDFTVALAWFWFAATAAFAIGAGLWRLAGRLRSAAGGSRRPGSEICPAPVRPVYPLLAMVAVGLLVHAAMLPPLLWWNARVFHDHSQKVAHTLLDEPAARLGRLWRESCALPVGELLGPLRPRS
ncbi:MAG: hypothetical protein ACPMAQ_03160 [Phycisphaerae bacterium]